MPTAVDVSSASTNATFFPPSHALARASSDPTSGQYSSRVLARAPVTRVPFMALSSETKSAEVYHSRLRILALTDEGMGTYDWSDGAKQAAYNTLRAENILPEHRQNYIKGIQPTSGRTTSRVLAGADGKPLTQQEAQGYIMVVGDASEAYLGNDLMAGWFKDRGLKYEFAFPNNTSTTASEAADSAATEHWIEIIKGASVVFYFLSPEFSQNKTCKILMETFAQEAADRSKDLPAISIPLLVIEAGIWDALPVDNWLKVFVSTALPHDLYAKAKLGTQAAASAAEAREALNSSDFWEGIEKDVRFLNREAPDGGRDQGQAAPAPAPATMSDGVRIYLEDKGFTPWIDTFIRFLPEASLQNVVALQNQSDAEWTEFERRYRTGMSSTGGPFTSEQQKAELLILIRGGQPPSPG
jgi:hypothetical protein